MIILPDIHGRTFWKETIEGLNSENNNQLKDTVVFLGDYLDPYPYESISVEDAMLNFEDILAFKKMYPSDVVLLLGNHDFGYIYPSVNSCRRSRKYFEDIRNMFMHNINLFDIAYTYKTDNKKYLFTHAGVHKYWLDNFTEAIGIKYNLDNFPDIINNAFHNEHYEDEFVEFIGQYSYFRGYIDCSCGSPVWADVREWSFELNNEKDNKELGCFQIFGHTQLESKPIVKDGFACIDVRRGFELTNDDVLIDKFNPEGENTYSLK